MGHFAQEYPGVGLGSAGECSWFGVWLVLLVVFGRLRLQSRRQITDLDTLTTHNSIFPNPYQSKIWKRPEVALENGFHLIQIRVSSGAK